MITLHNHLPKMPLGKSILSCKRDKAYVFCDERAIKIASEFFTANIIPNIMSGMRTLVDSTVIELVQANCASLQVEELMSRYKSDNDADCEVVYVDFDARCAANGRHNAVVLCMSCSYKLRIWTDDKKQTSTFAY